MSAHHVPCPSGMDHDHDVDVTTVHDLDPAAVELTTLLGWNPARAQRLRLSDGQWRVIGDVLGWADRLSGPVTDRGSTGTDLAPYGRHAANGGVSGASESGGKAA